MLALTGSTGFIGNYIAEFLPHPQKKLVRNLLNVKKSHSSSQVDLIVGDLTNARDVEALVSDANVLVHLASVNNPWTSNRDIFQDIQQNLLSTLRLFETFALRNPDGHIVFASTGGNMYNGQKPFIPRTENDPIMPLTSYSINKFSAEQYLRSFCKTYGIRATVLRISNPYGALLSPNRTNGLIGIAFAKLLLDEPLNVIDSFQSVRDYLHLDDLTSAFQYVIQSPPSHGEFCLFNVASGKGHSLEEVLNLIESTTKMKLKKNISNSGSIATWSVLSYQQIQEKLGWSPKITLKDGIRKMWEELSSKLQHL